MRIISLNAWGGTLHTALLPWLAEMQPDVLCLQEVIHSPEAEKDVLEYRDGTHVLQQRTNLFAEVRAALPRHVATFCPAAQGVLWDGAFAVPSQWGLATFVDPNMPLIGQAQWFVHKDFGPKGYGDHPRSRSAHAVRLWDFAADRAVVVAHMHGLRDLRGKMDTPERRVQAQRFLALARSVAAPDDQMVLCGDFNVTPGSETLTLLRDAGFTELVTARGEAGTRTSHYGKTERFADYMCVGPGVKVRGFEVLRTPEVSDHCPLILQI
ncbi:endonuclease/exonuclease/phosphatase family protein [Algicella marina]|uniref:Endonuclease/exonuclease/phosphatase family protein n=1 Tax=Algicella marina TaxID=2683284 RepID=A0A6P1T6A6_9RHOB|nr:endonuclease/exonuclease/phosphatase family protein [Algicella marina]QHQ37006.1 endonuclease/exonuclease/phosphatase family protein [Algicella marina]